MAANPPSDNVFVTDLPVGITQDQIQKIFSAYGTVMQCRVVEPKKEGQKYGGLVRFQSVEEATWVVENLNGNIAESLTEPIIVRFADNKAATKGGGKGAGQPAAVAAWVQGWPVAAAAWPAAAKGGKKGGNPPSDNVFVSDLPEELTDEGLSTLFSGYGTVVQSKMLPVKNPGMGKASGLVRFQSVEEATWVVENLNGKIAETMTEPITVRFADNKAAAKGGGKGAGQLAAVASWVQGWEVAAAAWPAAGKGGKRDNPPSDNVFVSDLPEELTDEGLTKLFSAYGTVVQSKMLPVKNPGMGKASGLVRFQSTEEAQWVVENLNHNIAEGMNEPIQVKFANAKGGDAKGGAKGAGFRSAPYAGGAKGGQLALPVLAGKYSYGKAGAGKGKGKGKGSSGASSMWELVKALRNSGVQGPTRVPQENQVFVRDLPPDCTDLDLYKIFAPFGAISPSGCTAMLHEDGSCRGFGFVDYADAATAQVAVQTLENVTLPNGAQINASIKKPKVEKGEMDAKAEGK